MKLNSIQLLRAVAASLVVYHHFVTQPISNKVSSWQQNFYHLKNFGCIGVDLFFVISGFIIMYVANKYIGFTEGIQFLIRRYCRIVPIYYITTLLFLGVLLVLKFFKIFDFDSSYETLGNSLADSFLILPTTEKLWSFSPLLKVGWTLSFEWLFYLFFFITIIFKVKHKLSCLMCLIVSLVVSGQNLTSLDFRLIFLSNPILLEFLLGVMVCWIYLKYDRMPLYIAASCLVIGVSTYIFLIFYGFGYIWNHMNVLSGLLSLERFLLWGLPSSFIVMGCVFLEKSHRLNRIWNNPWVQLIGDASYSIYLVHPILFLLVVLPFEKVSSQLSIDIVILIQTLIAIICSVAFYILVEKPLLRFIYHHGLWIHSLRTEGNTTSLESSKTY
jgi:peptidoglycan/LPS O-acetylase OafA/YrhL